MFEKIEVIADYIDNFDNKSINLLFLFMSGRSGSVLFQSLLDNHKQIIAIPPILPIYNSWDNVLSKSNNSIDYIISVYSKLIEVSLSTDSYNLLGKDKNLSANTYTKKVEEMLIEIFKKVKTFNRKNFLLATAFCYAEIQGYNFLDLKYILLHHHHLIPSYYLYDYEQNEEIALKTIDTIYSDFEHAKIIATIRDPINLYKSHLDFFTHKK